MVRLRLRMPVMPSDTACPLCDAACDRFGDHARVCPCGGDRTKRHNRLRSVLAARAHTAGLSPEVEKPGLLPARPDDGGAPEDGSSAARAASGRRPADVWVPHWGLHGAAAFDLAVTSGLRQGVLAATVASGGSAAADYEVRKRAHQQTEQACHAAGMQFVPMVVEACAGGWGPAATKAWKMLAQALAARSGETLAVESDRLYQALGIALQRENARSVLRRTEAPNLAAEPFADP